MKNLELPKLRSEYTKHSLDEKDVDQNPHNQFEKWLGEAVSLQVPEPTAMTLSTVDADHKPHSRIVLLKGFSDAGFVFYTNYDSDKGREIGENAHVALCFYWIELERQVRIEGIAKKVSAEESEEYFRSRPLQSQIGALASRQSREIDNRESLEKYFKTLTDEYAGKEIPMPENWGGYRVEAASIEFWQGRPSRLHDRIKYIKQNENWIIKRLSP